MSKQIIRIERIAQSIYLVRGQKVMLDFDLAERGVAARAPKYMEWYVAFALLVTLVWLYVEILRLLSRLARR